MIRLIHFSVQFVSNVVVVLVAVAGLAQAEIVQLRFPSGEVDRMRRVSHYSPIGCLEHNV